MRTSFTLPRVAALLTLLVGGVATAHPLDDQPSIFAVPPKAEAAKRDADPAASSATQSAINRVRAKAGAGYYKPVEVCRGDGERDVIVGSGSTNPAQSPVTAVGSVTVLDRPTCPKSRSSDTVAQ